MNALYGTAKLKIRPGKLDEFKRLAALCQEIARTQDIGTTQYDLFVNADFTEFMMHERYRDSESGLKHSENQGPDLMKQMLKTCTIAGEVCGNPSPALRKMLDEAGVALYTPYLSLTG